MERGFCDPRRVPCVVQQLIDDRLGAGAHRCTGRFQLGVAGSGDFFAAGTHQDRHRGFGELDGEGVGGWVVHRLSFRCGCWRDVMNALFPMEAKLFLLVQEQFKK